MAKQNSSEEKCLIETIIKGTERQKNEAFESLFKKHNPQLTFRIFGFVKDEELAHDLSQDTWIKIYKRIDKYDSSFGALSTWINTVAKHSVIDHIRTNKNLSKTDLISTIIGTKKENTAFSKNVPFQLKDMHNIGPVEQFEKEERLNIILSVLKKTNFSKEKKKIFIRIVFDGHKYDEISKDYNMPIGTVKTIINRIKCEMRRHLIEIGAKNNI